MTQDEPARFGRLGESRTYNLADSSCILADCWEPLVLIEKRAGLPDREHCGCRTKMTDKCPARMMRNVDDDFAKKRRAQGWVER